MNENVQIWIHRSIRPVGTDFQSACCVVWHTSAFSPSLPCLIDSNRCNRDPSYHTISDEVEVSIDGRWINCSSCIRSLLDSNFLSTWLSHTHTHCSSAVGLLLLVLTLTQYKLSFNRSLGINLLVQKQNKKPNTSFFQTYLWHFFFPYI